jgi:hypothetical protein
MAKQFNLYAPPVIWGPWMPIQSHGGSMHFNISYEAVGNTLVLGKVRYFKDKDKKTELQFSREVRIKTADVWASIEVCFKGIPLGSAVKVEIS